MTSGPIAVVVAGVLLVGTGTWLAMSIDDSESADDGVIMLAGRTVGATPADQTGNEGEMSRTDGTHQGAAARPMTVSRGDTGQGRADATPEPTRPDDRPTASSEPAAVNGLKISSQSWRRGGLGSKALITFTLRNDNPYAVKDVELACAFSRRDGSHLTDRARTVPGPVGRKSRKTFAAVHVGFVNVNASKAKCVLVAASKI